MQFYMSCSKFSGEPTIQPEIEDGKEVYKADKLEWFEVNNLPSEIISSAKLAIDSFANNTPFSQIGYNTNSQTIMPTITILEKHQF